jgi:hypothetical protein
MRRPFLYEAPVGAHCMRPILYEAPVGAHCMRPFSVQVLLPFILLNWFKQKERRKTPLYFDAHSCDCTAMKR